VGATLSGNVATGGAEPAQPLNFANVAFNGIVEGGAAYVAGAITVSGGTLADNRALASVFGTVRGGGLAQASSSSAAISITGTALTNNVAQGGFGGPNGVGGSAAGGAIAGAGPLTVTDVTASGNQAVGGNTDRSEGFGGTPGSARGGAFASTGVALVSGSTFSANRAQSGNAFVYCRLFTCTSAAPAATALGGGVWSDGALTLSDSVFEGNRAVQGGGSSAAIQSGGGAAAGSGDVTVTGGRYTGNSATGRGGAIQGTRVELRDVELTGNSAGSIWYTNLLGAAGSGGAVHAATLTAERVTATGNNVTGIGGGALSVSGDATIRSSSVRDNVVNHHRPWVGRQGGGGGISVAGSLDISDSAVIGNHGSASPDPTSNECYPFGCATSFLGGGIWAGSVTGRNLTVANNLALGVSWDVPSSGIRTVSGGGGLAVTGAASLFNATVSGNRVSVPPPTIAYLPARGAAVLAGALTLDHSTIVDNDAVNVVLPVMLATAARVPFPSLDAGSLVTTRSAAIAPADSTVCVAGTQVAGPSASSYNWFSDTSCALAGTGDHQAAASFFLGALGQSGGSVPVRVPGASSVLVDAIPLAACSSEPDARGIARPQGPACDIGAVEAVPMPGLGAADLALSFRQPGTVVPGQELVLELTLANRGPNASAPVIEIQPPPTVRVQSASVAGGPTCAVAATLSCVWTSALAANTNVVVTIQARPDSGATEPLVWTARAMGPELVPPLEDDTVTLTTPLTPKAGVVIERHWHGNSEVDEAGNYRTNGTFYLHSLGPSNALGTEQNPIELTFQPRSGVELAFSGTSRFVGSYAPGPLPQYSYYQLSVTGTPPTLLGDVVLRTGLYTAVPEQRFPLTSADIEDSVQTSSVLEGTRTRSEIVLQIVNHGPGDATKLRLPMELRRGTATWTASHGGVTASAASSWNWEIPSLPPNTTATLRGASIASTADELILYAPESFSIDWQGPERGTQIIPLTAP
jgi:hypothetical protein